MNHHNHETSACDEETGVVVKVSESDVWIERMSLEGCKSCSMSGVCGSKNTPQLRFTNNSDYKIGDLVNIHINSSTRMMSSFMIFIMPVILLICTFSLFFYGFKTSESISIAAGFISLLPSIGLIFLYDRYVGKKKAITISKKG